MTAAILSPRDGWRAASPAAAKQTRVQLAELWYAVRKPGDGAPTFDLEPAAGGSGPAGLRIKGLVEGLDLRLEILAFADRRLDETGIVRLSYRSAIPLPPLPEPTAAGSKPVEANPAATPAGGPSQLSRIGIGHRFGGGFQHVLTLASTTTERDGERLVEARLRPDQVRRLRALKPDPEQPDSEFLLTVTFGEGAIELLLSDVTLDAAPKKVAPSPGKPAGSKSGARKPAAAPVSPLTEKVRALFRDDDLFGLYRLCRKLDREKWIPIDQRMNAEIYLGRLFLKLNASETAYQIFDRMRIRGERPDVRFGKPAMRRLKLVLARAATRTGRIEIADELLTDLIVEQPDDWEAYYLLGGMRKTDQRIALFGAARALNPKLSVNVETALIEAQIEANDLAGALQACATASAAQFASEFCLTYGNIFLALGDQRGWVKWLSRYYAHHGLSAIDVPPGDDALALARIVPVPAPPSPFDDEVTVIMTCFNAAATVEMAIRSVLAQTHAHLKLFVVDDCSTDDSREIVARIAAEDPRVVPVANTTNSGTYVSKNSIIARNESPFFTFHDSDDWMHPQRIERHLEVMLRRPEVACTISKWVRMNEGGFAVVRKAGGYLHDNPASTMFRKDTVESCGYFDSVRTGADSEYLWRVRNRLGKDAIARLSLPLTIGLHHESSLTTQGAAAFDENRYSPVRLSYWESWINWQLEQRDTPEGLYVPFPIDERRFEAPPEIVVLAADGAEPEPATAG
jgi:hypothetical protein